MTQVVFDADRLSFRGLLEVFFQVHRPRGGVQPSGKRAR